MCGTLKVIILQTPASSYNIYLIFGAQALYGCVARVELLEPWVDPQQVHNKHFAYIRLMHANSDWFTCIL